jgi:hypothetical protein
MKTTKLTSRSMEILEQRLRCRTSGTSAYSYNYGDHDDSQNPRSSRDAEVDGFGTGIRKLHSTTACSGGDSLLLRPFGRPRGSERGRGRRPGEAGAPRRWRWRVGRRGTWQLVCSLLPKAPPYTGGGGAPYPLPKPALGRWPGRRR